jgi:exosome complex exonuclease RRP6
MTKTSNTLPSDDHFHYYSSYPAFEDAMSKQGNQSLRRFVAFFASESSILTNFLIFSIANVIKSSGLKGNIIRRDLEEKFELLLDTNDTLLEEAVR